MCWRLTLEPLWPPLSEEPAEQLGHIILEQDFVLAGRAIDSQGKPVPNANISVAGPAESSTWNLPIVRKLKADGSGNFHVRGLQAGQFKVTGWADNPRLHGSELTMSSFSGSTGSLEIVLEEQSRIVVSVSAEDESILAETLVFLVSTSKRVASDWNPGQLLVERADGLFALREASVSNDGLAFVILPRNASPADIGQVQAFARGRGWASSRMPVRQEGIRGECALELHMREEFRVRVTDTAGKPLSKGTVTVREPLPGGRTHSWAIPIAADGVALCPGVQAGSKLSVEADGFAKHQHRVSVEEGRIGTCTIQLDQGFTTQGE